MVVPSRFIGDDKLADRTNTILLVPEAEKLALLVLDHLAASEDTVSTEELLQIVSSQMGLDSREELLGVVRMLERDHYIARGDDGRFGFRFSLLKRWWQVTRGL